MYATTTERDRFWSRVHKTDTCWLWTAGTIRDGYGCIRINARMQLAHRVAYVALIGAIPEGMQVDHICRTRRCVNPDHLRLVTNAQNQQNLSGPRRKSASGVLGVHWHKGTSKWAVEVKRDGKYHRGGYFADLNDAETAAIALRNRLFTHNDADQIEREAGGDGHA